MSDKPPLAASWTWGAIALITGVAIASSIYGFVRLFLFQDSGLMPLIAIAVGVPLLLGICLYYGCFWKPAYLGKSRSRQWLRRSAFLSLMLVSLLTIVGVAGWQGRQSVPPANGLAILVADFPGPSGPQRITESIINNLRSTAKPYTDVRIRPLGQAINDSDGSRLARNLGTQQQAAIVIWGKYGKQDGNQDGVAIEVNVEILKPLPERLEPNINNSEHSSELQADIIEPDRFQFQAPFSEKLYYLTLSIVGLSRYLSADWDGAIGRFNSALDQVRTPIPALRQEIPHFYRANAYFWQRNYVRAIAGYTQAFKFNPNDAKSYTNRAAASLGSDDPDLAIADCTQAITLDPDQPLSYYNRAIANLSKNSPDPTLLDRALTDLNATLKRQPDFLQALYTRASLYAQKQEFERAIADYTQVLALKPDWIVARLGRGSAYSAKGDSERAIVDLDQVIRLQPDSAEAYTGRGIVYSRQQGYERAIADFNQALKLKPDFAEAYEGRGTAYRQMQRYDAALKDYNTALKLNPSLPDAYLGRGILYRITKEPQNAAIDLQQALKFAKNPVLRRQIEQELGEPE